MGGVSWWGSCVASAHPLLNLCQVHGDDLRCSIPRAAVGDTGNKGDVPDSCLKLWIEGGQKPGAVWVPHKLPLGTSVQKEGWIKRQDLPSWLCSCWILGQNQLSSVWVNRRPSAQYLCGINHYPPREDGEVFRTERKAHLDWSWNQQNSRWAPQSRTPSSSCQRQSGTPWAWPAGTPHWTSQGGPAATATASGDK